MAAGVSVIGAKATEGKTFTDPTFRAHRDGARQYPFELYWYYHYAQPGDPKFQADRLIDVVGPLLPLERLVLDLEGETPADLPAAPSAVLTWASGFIGELLDTYKDRRPLLYWSERIYEMIGSPTTWDMADEVDIILPRYGTIEPVIPTLWTKWTMWQFSETYVCPGVDGPCDASYFNGTVTDLRAYAKLSTPPAV
jgi:lysozyme